MTRKHRKRLYADTLRRHRRQTRGRPWTLRRTVRDRYRCWTVSFDGGATWHKALELTESGLTLNPALLARIGLPRSGMTAAANSPRR